MANPCPHNWEATIRSFRRSAREPDEGNGRQNRRKVHFGFSNCCRIGGPTDHPRVSEIGHLNPPAAGTTAEPLGADNRLDESFADEDVGTRKISLPSFFRLRRLWNSGHSIKTSFHSQRYARTGFSSNLVFRHQSPT